MNSKHRILDRGRDTKHVVLDFHRDEYGNFVFKLDNGKTWEFQPRPWYEMNMQPGSTIATPKLECIEEVTPEPPLPSYLSCKERMILLNNPQLRHAKIKLYPESEPFFFNTSNKPILSITGKCRELDTPPIEAQAAAVHDPTATATAVIIDAVRTEGATTRETVTGGFRGMLEKVGLSRKRAGWPRVSLKARRRAAAMWGGWSGVSMDTRNGNAKVDCFEYYKAELAGHKIESVEHFKAVIDAARKL